MLLLLLLLLTMLLLLLLRSPQWVVDMSLLDGCLAHGGLRLGWEGGGRTRCGLRDVGSSRQACVRCTWVKRGLG